MSDLPTGGRRPTVRFSLLQRLRLLGAFLRMGESMSYAAISGLIRGTAGARTYRRHLLISTVRALTDNLDILQMQYIAPPYDQAYREFCVRHSLAPDFVTQGSETIGFWLGSRTSQHTLMHFHGGAFAMDITPEHLHFWHKIQAELASSGIEISIFLPVYTLIPHKTYPTQFAQAVETLRYLIKDEGRKPGDITISGDSAGANLCAAIISHLSHPSTDVPKLELDGKLGGMIQLSPWLSFDTSWPSMKYNAGKDIDSAHTLKEWANTYLNGRPADNYSEPVLAPSSWWQDAQVEKTLVVVGEDEMFIDGVKAWARSFENAGNETKWEVAKGEYHIEPFIAPKFGDEKETGVEREIKAWLRERLG